MIARVSPIPPRVLQAAEFDRRFDLFTGSLAVALPDIRAASAQMQTSALAVAAVVAPVAARRSAAEAGQAGAQEAAGAAAPWPAQAAIWAALAGADTASETGAVAGQTFLKGADGQMAGGDFAYRLQSAETSGAAQIVDLDRDLAVIEADVPTVTLSFATTRAVTRCRLILRNSSGGALTLSLPASVKAPVLTPPADGQSNIYTIWTTDGGASYLMTAATEGIA